MSYGYIINDPGYICYYNSNGVYHRLDGPAVEHTFGDKYWFLYNKLHRLDGPAVELDDGTKEWWYKGTMFRVNSQEEFLQHLRFLAFI